MQLTGIKVFTFFDMAIDSNSHKLLAHLFWTLHLDEQADCEGLLPALFLKIYWDKKFFVIRRWKLELLYRCCAARFLSSFLIDARGGTVQGCRHSGVRVVIPPGKVCMPLRITCKLVRGDKLPSPPQLKEGEAIVSRGLELGPVAIQFNGFVRVCFGQKWTLLCRIVIQHSAKYS